MATPCKLLKLPLIVIEEVVGNMDFLELFNLSLCSQKSRKIISIMRKTSSIFLSVKIDCDIKYIRVYSARNLGYIYLHWNFEECKKTGRSDCLMRRIGGMMTDTRHPSQNVLPDKVCDKFPQTSSYAPKNRMDLTMNAAISHLLDTFHHCRIRSVRIFFDDLCTTFRASRALKSIKSVSTLNIETKTFSSIPEVKFLLSNVEVTEDFRYNSLLSLGTIIADKLNCSKSVRCGNSSWMQPETLWNMDCPYIWLRRTRFTSEDIEEFLRRWKNSVGENKNKIEIVDISHPIGVTVDYEALDAKPWVPAARPEVFTAFGDPCWDCSKGMDIRRTDGRIGTIMRLTDNSMKFLVWPK